MAAKLDVLNFDLDRLNESVLKNLGSAINAVLFTALVFTVGEAAAREQHGDARRLPPIVVPMAAPTIEELGDDPTTDDDGGWCTPAGCYIWADIDDPLGLGGGGWGGGSGGTGSSSGGSGSPPTPPAIPPSQLPDFDKLACAVTKYGKQPIKYPWVIDDIWAFNKGNDEMFSSDTPLPPPGFDIDNGVTDMGSDWVGGGQTILFAAGVSSHHDGFSFTDPSTHGTVTVPGPFSSFEWAVATLAHELAHQNGVVSEDEAEYYGDLALQAYRDDGGKQCP